MEPIEERGDIENRKRWVLTNLKSMGKDLDKTENKLERLLRNSVDLNMVQIDVLMPKGKDNPWNAICLEKVLPKI